MIKTNYIANTVFLLFLCFFGVNLIIRPEICEKSVANAIILCGRVLIPSLFPFSVCMLYIIKSGITDKISFLPMSFYIFVFSMLGGYPIGAKLINEAVTSGSLSSSNGRKMLRFCVNAGPAFIVSAVGNALLGSKKIGYILLFSHISASFLIFLLTGKIKAEKKIMVKKLSPTDNFVLSASDSASVVLSICGFVILFAVITSYMEFFAESHDLLSPILYLLEVTTAVTKTRNIYLISFLLGFSGFCIWCQVLSVGKAIKINLLDFALFRLLHGILSALNTFIILQIFPINLPTFSNIDFLRPKAFISGKALGLSLLILSIIFIISVSNRQKGTKILEEIL